MAALASQYFLSKEGHGCNVSTYTRNILCRRNAPHAMCRIMQRRPRKVPSFADALQDTAKIRAQQA
jgi:hypothetical protein